MDKNFDLFTTDDVKEFLKEYKINVRENNCYKVNFVQQLNGLKYNYFIKVDAEDPRIGKESELAAYIDNTHFSINVIKYEYDCYGKDPILMPVGTETYKWVKFLLNKYPDRAEIFGRIIEQEKNEVLKNIDQKINKYYYQEQISKAMKRNAEKDYTNLLNLVDETLNNQNAK